MYQHDCIRVDILDANPFRFFNRFGTMRARSSIGLIVARIFLDNAFAEKKEEAIMARAPR